MVEWAVTPQQSSTLQQTPQQQIPLPNTQSILRSLLTPQSPITSPPSSTPSLPDITPHRRPRTKKGRGQLSETSRQVSQNVSSSSSNSTNANAKPPSTSQTNTCSTNVTQGSTSGASNINVSSSSNSTNANATPPSTSQTNTCSTNTTPGSTSGAVSINVSSSKTTPNTIQGTSTGTFNNSVASSSISANSSNTVSPNLSPNTISLGSTLHLTFRSSPKKSSQRIYEKGSLNQDADIFPPQSRNKQCTAISYLAIIVASHVDPALWTSSIIDALVKMGDELYRCIPHQHDEIEYEDLPPDVHIHPLQTTFHAEQEWYLYGDLNQTTSQNNTYSLRDAVILACKASSRCLVTAARLTIGIINQSQDKYYLSDSHKRGGVDGLLHPDGTAVLCQFSNLDDVVDHLQKLFSSSRNRHYSIGAFSIVRTSSVSSQQQFTKVIKTMIVGINNYIGQVSHLNCFI